MNDYIVDFCCPRKSLVIELDGAGHFTTEGRLKDELRDAKLKRLGFEVLRFENWMVEKNINGVLDTIWEVIRSRKY